MPTVTRRSFITTTATATAAVLTRDAAAQQGTSSPAAGTGGRGDVLVASANGFDALDAGYEILRTGGDTLEAAIRVCRSREDDPDDDSVGLGGLPNEEGEVELDACCVHGPTRRAGAVAAVRNIRNVANLARVVMERTDHLLLVGEGAQRFAVAHGFPKENLLTDRSRQVWLLWKEGMSNRDSWGPGLSDPGFLPPTESSAHETYERKADRLEVMAADLGIDESWRTHAVRRVLFPPTGTIHVSALNARGEISGATTTSGLAWKIPGRVGDSAIIGAGCYADPEVGSAGATGRGEENVKICGAHTIIENLRRGMSPKDAALDALRCISRNYRNDSARLRYISMTYYVLRKDGAYAAVSMWSGPPDKPRRFAVHDGTRRLETCAYLLEGEPVGWPPTPRLPQGS